MRKASVVLLVLLLVGCKSPFGTTNTSHKYVYFMKDSINLHPAPTQVAETEGESSEGTELVFPDGSYLSLSGGGAAGNLMLTVMQNDGTDQTTKSDAKAAANANSPSATAGTEGTE